ncbi:LysR family transcriptional regulator [Pseudomonas botevensis]|uniref:LysR family transcriptional regulator n=1 Tax=Pseudomonas botevensis TaxID=2842352 RepID=UPI001C3CEFBA|nr:LysR family transcriptional regulator [Pseudomonas botevensis]MBV4476976.1 LysR family transcriptional regulator [Pseudomonas botevensis]
MRNLDLNLLRVFDAVIRERNVLRAGEAINLSPSAVSHALSRLRSLLNDELFVRTVAGMEPTVRALEMAPLVRDALMAIERAVGLSEFDPGATDRQFCIAATDHLTAVVLPHVLRAVSRDAPQASITVVPASRIDLTAQIDVGRVDIALGCFSSLPHRLREQVLFEEVDQLVLNADHPLASSDITLAALAGLPLLAVSTGGSVEGSLSERGLTRRMEMFDRNALTVAFDSIGQSPNFKLIQPHFLAIPSLLAGSDMAAIVPASLAKLFEQSGNLRGFELPWPSPPRAVQMVWHERQARDPGHAWLRQTLASAARQVVEVTSCTASAAQ